VGVAEYDPACKTFDVLLERADNAMYAAKNAGRNQVHVWEAERKGKGE
jgi:PleD family two-component response regulator